MWGEFDFEAFCHKHNIVITLTNNLSTKIRGYCYYDGEFYNVILNSKHSGEQLKVTTIHEIIHVMEHHFSCKPDHIEHCEYEVQNIVRKLRYVWST